MEQKGVHIEGVVYAKNGDIGNNEFLDEFLKFIESKEWSFGGAGTQVDEDGQEIEDIDS